MYFSFRGVVMSGTPTPGAASPGQSRELRPRQACQQPPLRIAPEGWRTFQQYNVLRILRGARPEPLPTLEIAERMIERTPGLAVLCEPFRDWTSPMADKAREVIACYFAEVPKVTDEVGV